MRHLLAGLILFVLGLFCIGRSEALTPQQRTVLFSGPHFTYYVNSATGNDNNNGRSFGSPFKNLSAVPNLTAGQSICLENGSYWGQTLGGTAQQLTLAQLGAAGITVAGCGNGPKPIIDGSAIIPPGNFTADGSGGYLTTTITFPDASNGSWSNVLEIGGPGDSATGTFLANVASQALCDSTAGSYFISGMSTSVMPASAQVCVHATDSTNPGTNGYTYRIGIINPFSMSSKFGQVLNIEVRNSPNDNGDIGLQGDGFSYYVSGVIVRNGAKHNILLPCGSTLTNSIVIDGFYPTGGGGDASVVFHDNIGSGLPITMNGNIVQNDQNTTNSGGLGILTSHTTTSGICGQVNFNNNTVIAKNGAKINGVSTANAGVIVANNNIFSAVAQAYAPQNTLTITGDQIVATYSGGTSPIQPSNGLTMNLTSVKLCASNLTQGILRGANFSNTYVLSSNLFYILSPSAISGAIVFQGGTTVATSLTANSNDFGSNLSSYNPVALFAASGSTFSGDHNIYEPASTITWNFNGATDHTLATWQASVSPQDANATQSGGSASSACTLPTLPNVS